MTEMRKYRRKKKTTVIAVQLNLEFRGFAYEKWGGVQICRPGDWLVSNGDDTYTVNKESFRKTYRQVSLGVYEKCAPVWAQQAQGQGKISTKEGATDYDAGDYLVSNDPDGKDGYAMKAEKFHTLYEPED